MTGSWGTVPSKLQTIGGAAPVPTGASLGMSVAYSSSGGAAGPTSTISSTGPMSGPAAGPSSGPTAAMIYVDRLEKGRRAVVKNTILAMRRVQRMDFEISYNSFR